MGKKGRNVVPNKYTHSNSLHTVGRSSANNYKINFSAYDYYLVVKINLYFKNSSLSLLSYRIGTGSTISMRPTYRGGGAFCYLRYLLVYIQEVSKDER